VFLIPSTDLGKDFGTDTDLGTYMIYKFLGNIKENLLGALLGTIKMFFREPYPIWYWESYWEPLLYL